MVDRINGNIEFVNGDVLAFESFFKKNFSKFFAFTNRFIDDFFAREDIVQEAFIAVWSDGTTVFEGEIALHAYMYKLIRNKCLDHIKHGKIKERFSSEYVAERELEVYMMQSVIDEESHFLIHKAIQELTPQCQMVIKLHLEGKKNKEIAEEMGISEVTVKFHKTIAYRQLYGSLVYLLLAVLLFR